MVRRSTFIIVTGAVITISATASVLVLGEKMKLVLISDTHEKHRKLVVPDGDVLVHAGDLTYRGDFLAVLEATQWLRSLPHKHKIVIAGNHDFLFETDPDKAHELLDGLIYLENSSVVIEKFKFWGSPITPWFFDWAFNCDRKEIHKYWDKIPNDTDVLITHGPPLTILDKAKPNGEGLGCYDLLNRVDVVRPKVHVFGHIHGGYGHREFSGIKFFNASVVDEAYNLKNKPWEVEL
jgi:Icc-related predicted phosphoesterase